MTSRANVIYLSFQTVNFFCIQCKKIKNQEWESTPTWQQWPQKYLITKKGSLCSNHDTVIVNRTYSTSVRGGFSNKGNIAPLIRDNHNSVLWHAMLCLRKQLLCKLWVVRHKNAANRPLYIPRRGKGSMASLTSRKLDPTLAMRGINGY